MISNNNKNVFTNPNAKHLETEAMKAFKPAPIIRVSMNIGGLEDVPTSKIVPGMRGQTVMLGGFAHVNSKCGGGNTFKTEQILIEFGAVLGRYRSASGIFYDTENTMSYGRIERVLWNYELTQFYDAIDDTLLPPDERKVTFVQAADMDGEEYLRYTRDLAKERTKNKRSAHPKGMVTVPVLDQYKKPIQIMAPVLSICDSLSMFTVASVVDKTLGNNDIGDSKNNTIFMKDGAAKTQMFIQLPGLTANGDIYVGFVAHVGNYIEMDPYAPKPGKLTFQKNGTKLKNVPEKFSFINNRVSETYSLSKLVHPKDKTPFYAKDESDKKSGNDLMLINNMVTRNKSGPTGVELNYVVSQKEGIDFNMSRFHLIKNFIKGGFGIEGNDQNYSLCLYPDVKLSRTTVRAKVSEDVKLQRAIGICSEMLQMQVLWRMPDHYMMTPQELKKAIEDRGYDWDMILNTREYWVFVEDEPYESRPELNTWDIIRMAVGDYHPYWLKEIPSKNKDKDKLIEAQKPFLKAIKEFEKACPHLMV